MISLKWRELVISRELKKRFTISIDEVETIKEDVVFKIPKKLN